MALIDKLERGFKDRDSIHQNTEARYFIVQNKKGEKYLQIDTFGSADRAIPGKVSQSLQFSPEALVQLKEILNKEL